MTNRLARSISPYLLQHADNPVDWWQWGEEAFAEARRRDVPILLSVGYAACHWCHVMAHESFEDHETAAQMNTSFVNVKVDREERPDVDAVYMAATQALTGQGGWPMTVFLTPEGRPFYAGTYYPPEPRHGMPSFRQVLTAVAEAWRDRRDQMDAAADRIAVTLSRRSTPEGSAPPTAQDLERAVRQLGAQEDRTHGGFGGAPKFPPSAVLEFLLRHAATDAPTAADAAAIAGRTLRAMARSGTYDQLEGGFARYAVDPGWVVPHFEKMLYDNAQLARVYLHWWRLTGERTGRRVAEETCDWMLAALGTPHGGLASSLDADTVVDGHGVEGATYVWTPQQLTEVLGEPDAAWAAELLGVTDGGTFEHGASTLRMLRDVADAPDHDPEAARWRRVREQLRQARRQRPQPARDDKVVTAWNGLAVAALAETGALCDRPDLVAAAERIGDLLVAVHRTDDGHLVRASRDGTPGAAPGVLEDYGDLAEGLFALSAATGRTSWAQAAVGLLDVVLAEFPDGAGGFHDTSVAGTDAAVAAVGRPSDPTDNAAPSGWTAAAGALLTAAALTGEDRYRRSAEAALAVVTALAGQAPRFAGWGLAVAQALLDGPREVAVVGPSGDPATDALHRTALAGTAPGLVVARGEPDGGDADGGDRLPLLRYRGLVAGRPAAYVCRGFVCDAPTTDPVELARAVGTEVRG
ncbi:thioredoxin domain-containing protein [Quadrisphaera sp. GCM10027208]|uniref:thioredoxin domain-containing protein n=1 Tax=Quadrisphaera sp. GCM10027208 TaxID=3273423 RepID=UPI00361DF349